MSKNYIFTATAKYKVLVRRLKKIVSKALKYIIETIIYSDFSIEGTEGVFDDYVLINPKVISYSEEMIYAGEGEGCLSVNREVDGIVPRHARATVGFYDVSGNYKEERVREEFAVAFQHEIDHLDGILFTDKIDKKDPFKDKDKMRAI